MRFLRIFTKSQIQIINVIFLLMVFLAEVESKINLNNGQVDSSVKALNDSDEAGSAAGKYNIYPVLK